MMDEEIRQALTEVREMKKMCGNINMKLTNIVTQRGQDWKKKLEAEYQRGLEEGKAQAERGCKGCEYEGKTGEHLPCDYCMNNFKNQWAAKDDEIKVGDVVMIKQFKHPENHLFVVTKVSDESVWGVEGDGSWNYWAINEVIKTDKHFDINEILGGLCDD